MLVFIHGPSYNYGSGNPYDGSMLAWFGELIVITLNYRLGAFGKLIILFLDILLSPGMQLCSLFFCFYFFQFLKEHNSKLCPSKSLLINSICSSTNCVSEELDFEITKKYIVSIFMMLFSY